jgi:hypothetical protein
LSGIIDRIRGASELTPDGKALLDCIDSRIAERERRLDGMKSLPVPDPDPTPKG